MTSFGMMIPCAKQQLQKTDARIAPTNPQRAELENLQLTEQLPNTSLADARRRTTKRTTKLENPQIDDQLSGSPTANAPRERNSRIGKSRTC